MGCGCEIAGIEELSDQWSRIPRMKFQVGKSDKALKIQSESVHHHFGAMVPHGARKGDPVSGSCFRPRRSREVQSV